LDFVDKIEDIDPISYMSVQLSSLLTETLFSNTHSQVLVRCEKKLGCHQGSLPGSLAFSYKCSDHWAMTTPNFIVHTIIMYFTPLSSIKLKMCL